MFLSSEDRDRDLANLCVRDDVLWWCPDDDLLRDLLRSGDLQKGLEI